MREYDRRITEVDIGMVARELRGAHVLHESDRLLQCDCPNHSSQSHRSLHVMLDKQGWYCFGGGVGGDVLQLLEFIQSGLVTRGQSGPMPESHQRARDFLTAKAELPSLAKYELSPEELAEAEAQRLVELRVHEVLTALAEHYHGQLKARFFQTSQDEPFMFFKDTILWMDTPDRGRKRLYASPMDKHTAPIRFLADANPVEADRLPKKGTSAPWGPVYGELLAFDDPETRLPAIDRMEGFHPGGPCLYPRVLVPV